MRDWKISFPVFILAFCLGACATAKTAVEDARNLSEISRDKDDLDPVLGRAPVGKSTFKSIDASEAESIDRFREYLGEYRRENRVLSFSIAVMKDGEIVMLESLGWQDHDAEEPTTPDTSYLVASITKTFTAATLFAMHADGHIDLDADFTTLSDWDERCEWLTSAGIIFGGARWMMAG